MSSHSRSGSWLEGINLVRPVTPLGHYFSSVSGSNNSNNNNNTNSSSRSVPSSPLSRRRTVTPTKEMNRRSLSRPTSPTQRAPPQRFPSQDALDRSLHNFNRGPCSTTTSSPSQVIRDLKQANANLSSDIAKSEANFMNQLSSMTKQLTQLKNYKSTTERALQEKEEQLLRVKEESAFQRHTVSELKSYIYQLEEDLGAVQASLILLEQKQQTCRTSSSDPQNGNGDGNQLGGLMPAIAEESNSRDEDDIDGDDDDDDHDHENKSLQNDELPATTPSKEEDEYYQKWVLTQQQILQQQERIQQLETENREVKQSLKDQHAWDLAQLKEDYQTKLQDLLDELKTAQDQASSQDQYRRDEAEDLRVLQDAQEEEICLLRKQVDDLQRQLDLRDEELQELKKKQQEDLQIRQTEQAASSNRSLAQTQQDGASGAGAVSNDEESTQKRDERERAKPTISVSKSSQEELQMLRSEMKKRLSKVLNRPDASSNTMNEDVDISTCKSLDTVAAHGTAIKPTHVPLLSTTGSDERIQELTEELEISQKQSEELEEKLSSLQTGFQQQVASLETTVGKLLLEKEDMAKALDNLHRDQGTSTLNLVEANEELSTLALQLRRIVLGGPRTLRIEKLCSFDETDDHHNDDPTTDDSSEFADECSSVSFDSSSEFDGSESVCSLATEASI